MEGRDENSLLSTIIKFDLIINLNSSIIWFIRGLPLCSVESKRGS